MNNLKKYTERLWAMKKKSFYLALVLFGTLTLCGCYIPGLGLIGEAEDPPDPTDPTGIDDTHYGKFIVYQVGGGKISKLGGGKVDYIVGDEVYFPSNEIKDLNENNDPQLDYNANRSGDSDSLTFNYKDLNWGFSREASKNPEAVVANNRLALYYLNSELLQQKAFDTTGSEVCGVAGDVAGDTIGSAFDLISFYEANGKPIGLAISRTLINYPGDVDYYSIAVDEPTLFTAHIRRTQIHGKQNPEDNLQYDFKLTLQDAAGNTLAEARYGRDFFRWVDPELTFFAVPGDTLYLRVEDLLNGPCVDRSESQYRLQLDAPVSPGGRQGIWKGEIQPARSGNPDLYGGPTFEPDDLTTKIEDILPDCDGIPGTGDEGDAGVFEQCGSVKSLGAGDGNMQYQEVDDKNFIDDGEWFRGVRTNVPAMRDSEPSVIHSPDSDSLLMFINYGSRIYMLESLDGEDGVNWDLSNLVMDRPSIVPLNHGKEFEPDPERLDLEAPVVSSGPLGFCETVPGAGDLIAVGEMLTIVGSTTMNWGGTVTGTGGGFRWKTPVAYPGTYAVTFGSNNHLDSDPLVDDLMAGGNTIHSGPDGIINTFFAPEYVAYSELPFNVTLKTPEPVIEPGDTTFSGPGVPDNPLIFSTGSGATYIRPLSGSPYNGDNSRAFLLGDDDMWNPAIFKGNTNSPAAYMQRQHCSFYNLGYEFDKCAYGAPVCPPGYSSPACPSAGMEPVAIESGPDGKLDTVEAVLDFLGGDDVLCHEGDKVGICPGPDGVFAWDDIYKEFKGDDRLEIVMDTKGPNAGGLVAGIGPGPDHILQTTIVSAGAAGDASALLPFPDPRTNPYNLLDIVEWRLFSDEDYICQTPDGFPAICPGYGTGNPLLGEFAGYTSLYTGSLAGSTERRLITAWPMYVGAPLSIDPDFFTYPVELWPLKHDLYGVYDDEFCIINEQVAICPGDNGRIQAYPISRRFVVAEEDDPFTLFDEVGDLVGQDCYSMVAEVIKDDISEEEYVRYVLYHYIGVRMDDKIKWGDPADPNTPSGFYISAGMNGINQSCMAQGDVQRMGFQKGLPNVPVIVDAGADGLETYPLKDELVWWGGQDGVYKISTGSDGVSNSFAMGDDNLDILFGTGKADHPCVISGSDGKADTIAQKNDKQLYYPGEYTGFDAFSLWGPDAVVSGGKVYLYYTALGWRTMEEAVRESSGALGDAGECERAGLDHTWGRNNPALDLSGDFSYNPPQGGAVNLFEFDRLLVEESFKAFLDNNQNVDLGPRIGVAVSTMERLRDDPSDWDFMDRPALDYGTQCAGVLSFPIDLPLEGGDLPGLAPDVGYDGVMSPDIQLGEREDEEGPLFFMYYTGLSQGTNFAERSLLYPKAQVGLARSLDGLNFQVVRDIDPLVTKPEFDLLGMIGGSHTQFGYPTVTGAGNDEFGEPMYAMFYSQFECKAVTEPEKEASQIDARDFDRRVVDHIGFALRKGVASLACSVGSSRWYDDSENIRSVLQVAILAVPLALILVIRFSRKKPR